MIPKNYKCGHCGADGVKLWRKSATSEPVLQQPLKVVPMRRERR